MEKYKRKAESSWTEKDLDKALEAVRAGMSMQEQQERVEFLTPALIEG